MPFLVDVNAEDLTKAKIMPGESTQAVLGTIELVVHTLQSCLPSTTRMSRQYSMQSEDMLASDVTRLLDISVDLIDPASKAFSYVAEQSTTKDLAGNAATVEFQSIRRVFDEQAAILRDWNAKHTQDIELKLANNSPAKLASIADSVQRIVTILCKQ